MTGAVWMKKAIVKGFQSILHVIKVHCALKPLYLEATKLTDSVAVENWIGFSVDSTVRYVRIGRILDGLSKHVVKAKTKLVDGSTLFWRGSADRILEIGLCITVEGN